MKSVIITGASRGIGLETALAFGHAGYKVFATMRNPEGAPDLEKIIKKESLAITISAMDVDSDKSVKTAIDTILQANGPVDVLVNNAGTNRPAPFLEVQVEDYDFVTNLNVRAAFFVAQAVARHMIAARSSSGISIPYLTVLVVGFALWFAYGVALHNWALIIPNTIAFVVGATTIAVARHYRR